MLDAFICEEFVISLIANTDEGNIHITGRMKVPYRIPNIDYALNFMMFCTVIYGAL